MPATHPISAWLLEHVCLILNARMVGEDGKTAWKRLRGRDFGQRLIGFLESVFYKQPPKGPQHDANGNMAPRMFPGIFLGYHHTSNCYRVATADGNVIKIRSVLRRPFADRWCAESIKSIKATPWSLRAIAAPDVIELGRPVEKPVGVEDDRVPIPRRLKITARILETYGTTDGCAQCSHIRAFRETKPGLQHTTICRKRIVDAMAATDAGANQLERFEARVDRAIASRIESGDVGAEQPQAQTEVDDDLADQRFAESVRLPPHPSERQAPAAPDPQHDDGPELYSPMHAREDEDMGETLTVGEIMRRMRRDSLRGHHTCDSRIPARTQEGGG